MARNWLILSDAIASFAHPFAAHKRVSHDACDKIVLALLKMAESPTEKKLFEKIPIRSVVRASMADYDDVRARKLNELAE